MTVSKFFFWISGRFQCGNYSFEILSQRLTSGKPARKARLLFPQNYDAGRFCQQVLVMPASNAAVELPHPLLSIVKTSDRFQLGCQEPIRWPNYLLSHANHPL